MRNLFVAGLVAVVACNLANAQVLGNGTPATQDRVTAGFDGVTVAGALTVEIAVGPKTSVAITGDANVVPLVETTVRDHRLYLRTRDSYQPKLPLRVRITTPTLTSLAVGGAGQVAARGLRGDRFALDASGAGRVALGGTAGALVLDARGAAVVDAAQLRATDATVAASGASQVAVTATRGLTVGASGAARVTYGGGAAITPAVAGAARVERR
ncbi:MAG: head GIN domain-containing protein [Kofleriaceae bacterium]